MQLCLGWVSKGSGKVKVKCLMEGSIFLAPERELPVRNEHVGVTSTEVTADFVSKYNIVQGEGMKQGQERKQTELRGEWSEVGQPGSLGRGQ